MISDSRRHSSSLSSIDSDTRKDHKDQNQKGPRISAMQVGDSQDYPPVYTPPGRAPSGERIALTFPEAFPAHLVGSNPCTEADGSPVYLGSALGSENPSDPLHNSIHPCKIVPHLSPPCRVPYGGAEYEHRSRYDLLPFDQQTMKWVPASHGRIPDGRIPIIGGVEIHGAKLYHALGQVTSVWVPGKTGIHLNGCHVAYDNTEHVITDNYFILCWREQDGKSFM